MVGSWASFREKRAILEDQLFFGQVLCNEPFARGAIKVLHEVDALR